VGDSNGRCYGAFPTAGGGITRLAYTKAKDAGVDLVLILKKAGLTLTEIEDAGARLRVRDQISFLNLVADAMEDDFLGFHLAQSSDLRELGFLYYVSASSELLGEALQRVARYGSIANEGMALRYVSTRGAGMAFEYVGVSRHVDRHQIEFFTTALVRVCRHLTGYRLFPTRVQFVHHRNGVCSDFVEFFGGKIEFDALGDGVTFAANSGHMRVVSADAYLNKILITYCEEALSRRPIRHSSFRSNVENAIVPLLPHGKAQAGEIARRLGISQRTFAWRLSFEGCNFSEVLDGLKLDLAHRYLRDEDLSISQIAWLLGYQEVSAFTHAFKRWTGKTPRETRSRIVCDLVSAADHRGSNSI
jgi:AraC-like DNA-binding protein